MIGMPTPQVEPSPWSRRVCTGWPLPRISPSLGEGDVLGPDEPEAPGVVGPAAPGAAGLEQAARNAPAAPSPARLSTRRRLIPSLPGIFPISPRRGAFGN